MLFADIDGRAIEYRIIPGPVSDRPPLVFLHEGLGCAALWRDFPDKVAREIGAPALVYSRFGYGQSAGIEGARTPRFMHEEALDVLPALLDRCGISQALLVGHSDGASIALIHAGAGHRARGVVAMAPHVFIEPVCLSSIEKARAVFEATDLPEKLGRYHRDARKTFYGWADVWTQENFKRWDIREDYLTKVCVPVLAIQGYADEYGTMAQLDEIARHVGGPCELLKLGDCGHTPFRDQPERTLAAVTGFVDRLK
jgi:pimeloyl-ACP methyl ester carboxylesterase